jgi:hypothetical protein
MALNNCTINSTSVAVTPNTALTSSVADQVLTITPNTGYRVAAADFTNNTGSITGVSGITLANSGTAYASDNTVTVTVDLDDAYVPTAPITLTIDIDGDAVLDKDVPNSIAGGITVSLTNATISSGLSTYSGSGIEGTNVDLFTRTVTASSGYYFDTQPTYSVTTGNPDNYVVNESVTRDGDNNIITRTFDVNGIIPAQSVSGDVINISATAVAIPATTNRINSYSIDTSSMSYNLSKRGFIVYGDVGATFTLSIARSGDSYTYDFSTNDFTSASTNSGTLTIASNGQYSTLLSFPAVTADVTYTFTIAAVSPTTLNLTQTNPFTISRSGFKTVTVNATSTSRGTFQSKTISYTDYAGTTITQSGGANATYGQAGSLNEVENDAEFNFSIVIDDDEAFVFSSPNASENSISLGSSDFSTTGDADIASGSTTAARSADGSSNANQLLTITGSDWYNWQHGTTDTVITFNIDEFCDAGGGGGANVLGIGGTNFRDISSTPTVIYPSSYSQQVTGRTSESTSVTYTFTNLVISYPDVPSFVDNGSDDITITAQHNTGSSTKFQSATYTVSGESYTITNGGTSSVSVTVDFTVTVTSFGSVAASGDQLNLLVNFAFSDITP